MSNKCKQCGIAGGTTMVKIKGGWVHSHCCEPDLKEAMDAALACYLSCDEIDQEMIDGRWPWIERMSHERFIG